MVARPLLDGAVLETRGVRAANFLRSARLASSVKYLLRMFRGKKQRARAMFEPKIIDRGRGPEIAGTPITVYDVLDYHKAGWHRDRIAGIFNLSSLAVDAALRYIDEHRAEVMADYEEILAALVIFVHGASSVSLGSRRP
jgi:uncharacterized protein (DUF433 family)